MLQPLLREASNLAAVNASNMAATLSAEASRAAARGGERQAGGGRGLLGPPAGSRGGVMHRLEGEGALDGKRGKGTV